MEPAESRSRQQAEVMVNDADDVEPVGHDARIGEVQPDQGAIVGRQIHAHHAHLGFAC